MVLSVDAAALLPKGPTVTFSLDVGQSVGIFGPAGSGKSRLCRGLAGVDKLARGTVKRPKSVAIAELRLTSRRITPLAIGQKHAGPSGAERIANALSAVGLWEQRRQTVASLTEGQLSALAMVPVLASNAKLIVVDRTLDTLDPWTLGTVLEALAARLRAGAALVLATNRPEFARRMDTLIVLKQAARDRHNSPQTRRRLV